MLVSEPGGDGVFRHVEGLSNFLLERGHRVHLAYSSKRSSDRLTLLVRRIVSSGGKAIDLRVGPKPQLGDVLAFIKLLDLSKKTQSEIIHGHSSKAGALTRMLPSVGVDCPIFYTPHAYFGLGHTRGGAGMFFNLVERCLGRSGISINVSRDEADFASRVLKIGRDKLRLIHNGVSFSRFVPPMAAQKNEIRRELGLPRDALILGTVGRTCGQKDPMTMYKAFALVATRLPNLLFYHLGTGELDAKLKELSKVLGINDRIVRCSYMADPVKFYQSLDGFILTSRYEGLAYSILEALACNLPLIVSSASGSGDLLSIGLTRCGIGKPGDAQTFADAIEAWASSVERGESCNHREIAAMHFSEERCFNSILAEYSAALAGT